MLSRSCLLPALSRAKAMLPAPRRLLPQFPSVLLGVQAAVVPASHPSSSQAGTPGSGVGEASALGHYSSPATPIAAVPTVCREQGWGERATPGSLR